MASQNPEECAVITGFRTMRLSIFGHYIIYHTNELMNNSKDNQTTEESGDTLSSTGRKMPTSSNIDYIVKGSLSKPSIVFIHELGGSLNSWQWLDPLLGEDYCRIYINIPKSTIENGDPLSPLASTSEELKLLIDELGLSRVHLVGAAYGSITSVYFAALHPDRVDQLVLMALGPKLPESVNQYILDRADIVEKEGMLPVREMSLKNSFPQEFREDHPVIIAAYEGYFAKLSPQTYVACSRALANLGDRLVERLSSIRNQALVVGGALDPAFSVQDHGSVARLLETNKPIILDGVGHFPHIESPSKAGKIIQEFLGKSNAPEE